MSATGSATDLRPPELDVLFEGDGYLRDYESDILLRWRQYEQLHRAIEEKEGGLACFSEGYKRFGLVQRANGDIECLEWVPNAESVSLAGDFNHWDPVSHSLEKRDYGRFYLCLKAVDGRPAIGHNTMVKLRIITKDGQTLWRHSPWTRYSVQNEALSMEYQPIHWAPPTPYLWQHDHPTRPKALRIYEAHVGISSPEARVASYRYFADSVVPYIAELGYNTVELMAVMEHAYYGSFGYHVTNFFAVSSRYGNPDDLKYLVDKAHGHGLTVILDVVHSHAAKNVKDGLNQFDGTDYCHFHAGPKGDHTLWDSKIFNYSKWEVLRFLLSNLRWYVEEYRFDGFRFDGVTSMLYHHHGIATGFSGNYSEYFNTTVDLDAVVYLMLANDLLHRLYPFMITIAEDVSGMPSLCRPVSEGGIGFDYRLAMAIPDMWIKMLKEQKDDDWSMNSIWWTLTNRRHNEKCIAYAESHDQALVGDKTISFWLLDSQMYTNMSVLSERTVVIDRGVALHKMIRLITMGLGGESYLTFIGNEFGHPEWLDFPREGNNFSYHYARRQFNLVQDPLLRYQFLKNFDADMQKLEEKYHFLSSGRGYVSRKHDDDKVMVFERGQLVFVFNFHATKSYPGYKVGVAEPGTYMAVLNSDSDRYHGHGRIDEDTKYCTMPECYDGRPHLLQLYIPSRVTVVLALQN